MFMFNVLVRHTAYNYVTLYIFKGNQEKHLHTSLDYLNQQMGHLPLLKAMG